MNTPSISKMQQQESERILRDWKLLSIAEPHSTSSKDLADEYLRLMSSISEQAFNLLKSIRLNNRGLSIEEQNDEP